MTFHPHRFEEVPLRPGSFDLGVAATSFHWLPERRGLRKVARALRPGGWWAAWGNEHGD
ncbi:Methyltransferase type 11, partial [mine drainage metagenome]